MKWLQINKAGLPRIHPPRVDFEPIRVIYASSKHPGGADASLSCSGGLLGGDRFCPVSWPQFRETMAGMLSDAGGHVGEPGLRVDSPEPRGNDKAIQEGGAPAAVVGVDE